MMNRKFFVLLFILILIGAGFIANKTIANDKISQDNIKKIEKEKNALA